MHKASSSETVDSGSNQKLQRLIFTAFLFDIQDHKRNSVKPLSCVVDRWQRDSKTETSLTLPPGRGNLVNKDVIAITIFYALHSATGLFKPEVQISMKEIVNNRLSKLSNRFSPLSPVPHRLEFLCRKSKMNNRVTATVVDPFTIDRNLNNQSVSVFCYIKHLYFAMLLAAWLKRKSVVFKTTLIT